MSEPGAEARPPRAVAEAAHEDLARALAALANPVRIALLNRLERPAFMPELAREFGLTRQALKRHLDDLQAVDLVLAKSSRRGALPATQYMANPAGLFALKETMLGLAVSTDPAVLPPARTAPAPGRGAQGVREGMGLLLVHGDVPGRWFPLAGRGSWIIGRDAGADVALPYDPFASQRHALLRRAPEGWTLTDLHSMNGTRLNLRPVPAGEAVPVRPGDLLTVGRSQLLLRGEA